MMKFLLAISTLGLVNSASAHTGMAQSSVMHYLLHSGITIGVYLAIMAAGFYLLRKMPKAKRVRIKKK